MVVERYVDGKQTTNTKKAVNKRERTPVRVRLFFVKKHNKSIGKTSKKHAHDYESICSPLKAPKGTESTTVVVCVYTISYVTCTLFEYHETERAPDFCRPGHHDSG